MIPIPADFREFLRLLNRRRVKYLVVGGYAVVYHGYPRYTGDIDIFVAVSPSNTRALVKVFSDFGFADAELTPEFFAEYGRVIRLGREPFRLEVVNKVDGVTFAACYSKRVRARRDGLTINFIGYDDLLKNKRASNRLKDQQDVAILAKIPPPRVR